jgi:hypothetical protein
MRVNDTGAPSEWNAVAHRPCRSGRHGAIGHGTTKSRDEHGSPPNPLFLLNHWLHRSPPDPGAAGAANAKAVLKSPHRLVPAAATPPAERDRSRLRQPR